VENDSLQFLDDDDVVNVTSLMPAEKEQPASWPLDVLAIFLGAALILFAATAYKNYRRRSTYTEVPTSQVVY
jgi:hypothetical protein